MYQAVIPSPMIMQVVNQQTNGQCPTTSVSVQQNQSQSNVKPTNDPHSQSHHPYSHSHQHQSKRRSFTVNASHSNRHQFIQQNNYPVELYQMMRIDVPPVRKLYGNGNTGNWHRRNANNHSFTSSSNINYRSYNNNNNNTNYHHNNNNHNYNHNDSNNYNYNNNNNNMNNSNNLNNSNNNGNNGNNSNNHKNFNNSYNNNNSNNSSGSTKKHWNNNRSNKRNNTFREQLPQHNNKEGNNHHYNSDSGFSSRSPTPNKHQSDSQTESSDDRDSISSNAKRNNNKKQEVWSNVLANVPITPPEFIHNIPPNNNQFFPSQFMFGFYSNNTNPQMRPQVQHSYQGKKRSQQLNRGSPSSQKYRGKKNHQTMMGIPTFTNVLPKTHLAPDRYLARAHLMQVTVTPDNLYGTPKWDDLTKEIWDMYIVNQQTEHTFRKKMMLWKYLFIYIKTVFPKYSVFLVGSTMNGFGGDTSDVDICLLVRNTEIIQRAEAICHLHQIMKCLEYCDFIKQLELIQAKVPILKFQDTIQKLDVDLNCNNAVGVRNTHMLYCYSQIDWRVRPLVLIVKLWAQSQNINDAKNMTISSYSLALMVIHFLQCGVSPPILPCLQTMYSYKFNSQSDVHTINIHEDLKISMDKINDQCLGELLNEFFKYYVNFDFTHHAVSVRLAKKISIEECRNTKAWKNNPFQWKYLCVEEPFDLTNTARSVYDYDVFLRIITVFRRSYQRLRDTRNLANIFVNLAPRVGIRYPRPPASSSSSSSS